MNEKCPPGMCKCISLGLASVQCGLVKRRRWHPTPVLLPGKSHGWRSLVGCRPWDHEESDTTEQLHFHFSLSCTKEGNGNLLQYSCLQNPRDGGAWWAAVSGVAESDTTEATQQQQQQQKCGLVRLSAMRWKGVCVQALQATSLVLHHYHTCTDSSNAVLCFSLNMSLSIIPSSQSDCYINGIIQKLRPSLTCAL